LQQNYQITIQMLSEEVNISNTACHTILSEDSGKIKLNARLVPHSLTPEQKEDCPGFVLTF
jgi:hypothetical protein